MPTLCAPKPPNLSDQVEQLKTGWPTSVAHPARIVALFPPTLAQPIMSCDTLDDVPEPARNALFLNELLFSQLRHLTGVVFSGLASQQFCHDSEWGSALQLSTDETLQFRIFPKGLISGGQIVEKHNTFLLAARRRAPTGKDFVSLAILWDPTHKIDLNRTPIDCMRMTQSSVSCRNLHIVLPSLFNHHDSAYGGAKDGERPNPSWPVLDEFNYHSIRPSSFSITRPVKVHGSDDSLLSVKAAPGISQFVMAGFFAGVECEDVCHRAAEPIPYSRWEQICSAYTTHLTKNAGSDCTLQSMHNAMTIADLLSAEGLLGLLSHNFCTGALPDMMHSPGGFPLLIAFAVRLACYPNRFGLASGTQADDWANRELLSLFESNWSPLTPDRAGGHNFYAIDVIMKGAFKDAMNHAKKHDTRQSVVDNICFWQRSGQRCISTVFGPRLDDFVSNRSQFGYCDQLTDPLEEAKNRVLRQNMHAHECSNGLENQVCFQMATMQQKRQTLLMVLNSVEHWARTGQYCEMQIHAQNKINMKVAMPKKGMTKMELRQQFNAGMEASVKEMMDTGEYEEEAKARHAASVIRDGLEAALAFHEEDDPLNFEDLQLQIPATVIDDGDAVPFPDEYKKLNCVDMNPESVCHAACMHGMSALGAAMCQGPMVHHQFAMTCFLTAPNAVNKCADCDAEVHVLTSTFLSTRLGSCPQCQRPRCLPCMARVHSSTEWHRLDTAKGCLRCKATDAKKKKKSKKDKQKERANEKIEKVVDELAEELESYFTSGGLSGH